MRTLAISTVKKWTPTNGVHIPRSISTSCPHCDSLVTFTLTDDFQDPRGRLWTSTGTCPACDEKVTLIIVEPASANDPENRDPGALCIHPSPRSWHQEIELTDNVPDPLRRLLMHTILATM